MSEENTAADAADDSYDDDAYFNEVAGNTQSSKFGPDEAPEDDQDEPESEPDNAKEKAEEKPEEKADEKPDEPEEKDWKAEYQRLDHRVRSDDGRQAALQKQVKELKDQLSSAPKPKIESLEKAREDLPEFAQAIEDALARQREELEASFNERLTPLQEAQQQNAERSRQTEFQSNVDRLASEHPDWQSYDIEKNTDFAAWYEKSPGFVKDLYGAETDTAAKAAHLISLYKTAQGQKAGDAAASRSDATTSKQARLERTRIPPTTSGGSTGGGYSDDEYFNRTAMKTYRDNYQR